MREIGRTVDFAEGFGRPRRRPRPKAVLFDAGGTLVQLHVERLSAALTQRGHDPHELDAGFWAAMVLLDDEFGPDAGAWDDWWDAWLARFAGNCRVPREVMTA